MTKHWFIAHLIEKFTKNKTLGLDIGIGLDNWTEFKKCKMIGIDRSPKKKTNLVLDLEKPLPFKDDLFDVVIAINSLNYVENSRLLLEEINRVMKNNGILVCVVDNEKSTSHPHIWEKRYLNRILNVTGFHSILSKNVKDNFYAWWYNRTSVYAFAVVVKTKKTIKKEQQICSKCGKILYEKTSKNSKNEKYFHYRCLEPVSKKPKSYSVFTTHPDS